MSFGRSPSRVLAGITPSVVLARIRIQSARPRLSAPAAASQLYVSVRLPAGLMARSPAGASRARLPAADRDRPICGVTRANGGGQHAKLAPIGGLNFREARLGEAVRIRHGMLRALLVVQHEVHEGAGRRSATWDRVACRRSRPGRDGDGLVLVRLRGRSARRGRPVVDASQGLPHQRSPVTVREAVGDAKRLHALCVGQQRHRPRPVRAPQAALQSERVEDALRADPRDPCRGRARATACRRR